MSNFRLVESQTLPLTRELAQEFREMKASHTERALNPRRVKHLTEKAEAGKLVAFNWAKVKLDGEWLRMNGQHSSTMLTELNGSFPDGLFVHMDAYEVTDEAGESDLFRQFDDRMSSRSPLDVAGAYMGQQPALHEVNVRIGKLGIEGVLWYRKSVEGIPVDTGDDRYQAFKEKGLHSFLIWLNDLFSIKTPEMRKVQVVSGVYASFSANETAARAFWDHVARGGVEYEETHPASVLSEWLIRAKQGELREPPKAAHYYQACVYAWNAHREGKEVKTINPEKLKNMLEPVS